MIGLCGGSCRDMPGFALGWPYRYGGRMSNTSGRPVDNRRVLQPMEPDQARYHCQILRAIADLIAAGEPTCWAWSYASVPGDATTVSISFEGERFRAAQIAVHQRVEAGDPDYSIKVEYREPSKLRTAPRRRGR